MAVKRRHVASLHLAEKRLGQAALHPTGAHHRVARCSPDGWPRFAQPAHVIKPG
jgi:hypothetical protein